MRQPEETPWPNPTPSLYANQGLDPFLFAEVRTKPNGSGLTILPVLARLGFDPWAEAGRWSRSSKAVAIDGLAQSIAKMPLSAEALLGCRDTASRLVLLLPARQQTKTPKARRPSEEPVPPNWIAIALLCGMMIFGIVSSLGSASRSMAPSVVSTHNNAAP